jgi:hypothetical protein
MKKKPIIILFIGWLLIICDIVYIVYSLIVLHSIFTYQSPLKEYFVAPYQLSIAMILFGIIITFVCAFGILEGKNWARFLYVGWLLICAIMIIKGYKTEEFGGFTILCFIFIIIVLFIPPSNKYFVKSD